MIYLDLPTLPHHAPRARESGTGPGEPLTKLIAESLLDGIVELHTGTRNALKIRH
ncbi:hypothetical protein FHX58_007305 [Paraburkholderia tropica]|nr:hypothetical protein [Paraburkholderia tropica]